MSTRCQLRFIHPVASANENEMEEYRVAQLYRHSDGYPEAVLDDLARLKQLLDSTRSERGPTYAAAQFVFLDKLTSMQLYLDGDPERTIAAEDPEDLLEPVNFAHIDQPAFLLGHGFEDPTDGIHGDEEYLYIIELPRRQNFDEPSDWTVKVSGHASFPRWEGPTEEAFERATWEFEGPLHGALEILGGQAA
ncbi:MAG: hypothetical protein ABEH59_12235 [Halobacteriales archaeon]